MSHGPISPPGTGKNKFSPCTGPQWGKGGNNTYNSDLVLKSKLFSYGIGGKTLKWIDSFLGFRQQRVVNIVESDWAPVLSGAPQGTVLGPLLFSLYINNISSDIESKIKPFANDCLLS